MRKIALLFVGVSLVACGGVRYDPELQPSSEYRVDWGNVVSAKASERYPEVWLAGPVQYLWLKEERDMLEALCSESDNELALLESRARLMARLNDTVGLSLATMPRSLNDVARFRGVREHEQSQAPQCRDGMMTQELWQQIVWEFWALRDPTPGTEDLEDNEYREEFYRRVSEVENAISVEGPLRGRRYPRGYRTDQAMTYIVLGHPMRVRSYPRGTMIDPDPFTGNMLNARFEFDVEVWYYAAIDISDRLARQIGEIPFVFARTSRTSDYHFFTSEIDRRTGAPNLSVVPEYIRGVLVEANWSARWRSEATRGGSTTPTREDRLRSAADTLLPMTVEELASPIYAAVIDGWNLQVGSDDTGAFVLPIRFGADFMREEGDDLRFVGGAVWEIPLRLSGAEKEILETGGGRLVIVFSAAPSWITEISTVQVGIQEKVIGRSNTFRVNLAEHRTSAFAVSQPLVFQSEFSRRTAIEQPESTAGLFEVVAIGIARAPMGNENETTFIVATGFDRNEAMEHVVRVLPTFHSESDITKQNIATTRFHNSAYTLDALLFRVAPVPVAVMVKDYLSGAMQMVQIRH